MVIIWIKIHKTPIKVVTFYILTIMYLKNNLLCATGMADY